jgi:hypothetical protein
LDDDEAASVALHVRRGDGTEPTAKVRG